MYYILLRSCVLFLVVIAVVSTHAHAHSFLTDIELDGFKGLTLDNYNRVDGLPVSYGLSGKGEVVDFKLRAIYRVASERVGWKAGMDLYLARMKDFKLSLSTYSFSDTEDRWRVGDFENSLSSILFKEDFRNYFQRQGLTASFRGELGVIVTGWVEYSYDRYSSLPREAEFSFFGWGKEFRPNPPVEEGWMGSLKIGARLDTRNDPVDPTVGWYQSLLFEISRPDLGGDFDFQRVTMTIRRYNRLGKGKSLDARFHGVAGSSGTPPQRGIHIHGVGGLRAYPDEFIPTSRGFVSSLEARFDLGRGLKRTPLYRDGMKLLLFAEIGGVDTNSGEGMEVDGDAGIGLEGAGLITYSGIFLGVRLDGGCPTARVTFRVRRDL